MVPPAALQCLPIRGVILAIASVPHPRGFGTARDNAPADHRTAPRANGGGVNALLGDVKKLLDAIAPTIRPVLIANST
jgi:hypothetical protein